MKLIVDSGSTKTDWILSKSQTEWKGYSTVGYNPYFIDTENIYVSIRESLLPHLENEPISEIDYYGAGCSTPAHKASLQKALKRAFPKVKVIRVEHDMLAAARALLFKSPGFAAILGTGTNTCLYDGENISYNIDSLGYLLGDEGSGSYIGKRVLRNYMRRYFDKDLADKFAETHLRDNEEIFTSIYKSPLVNRALASYATFAGENKDHPQIQVMVRGCFRDFFSSLVSHYPNYKTYTFNCIGTIGFVFADILEEVCKEFDMQVGSITQKPIEGLLKYHYQN